MTKKGKWLLRLLFWLYMLYAYVVIYRQNSFYSFLVLNTFLAYLPLEFAMNMNERQPKAVFLLLFIFWLLFYPNAPYVLTDLLHFARMHPYDLTTGLMKFDLHIWLNFTNLCLSALSSLILGTWSLEYITQLIQIRLRKPGMAFRFVLICGLTLFSSIGIYVGRFLRLHTAYLFLNPGMVIRELILMWNLKMLTFVFMMFILQMLVWGCMTVSRIALNRIDFKYNLQ